MSPVTINDAICAPIAIVTEADTSAPLLEIEDWQRVAIKKIASLRSLEVGWDGSGSVAPTPQVCDWACKFILRQRRMSLRSPEFFPESGGALQINWFSGYRREIEIHVQPDGTCETLKIDAGKPTEEMNIPQSSVSDVDKLIDWLRRG